MFTVSSLWCERESEQLNRKGFPLKFGLAMEIFCVSLFLAFCFVLPQLIRSFVVVIWPFSCGSLRWALFQPPTRYYPTPSSVGFKEAGLGYPSKYLFIISSSQIYSLRVFRAFRGSVENLSSIGRSLLPSRRRQRMLFLFFLLAKTQHITSDQEDTIILQHLSEKTV